MTGFTEMPPSDTTQRLVPLLLAAAPVVGLIVGNPDDKATWVVQFDDAANPEQRAAAQAVIDAYDPDAVDLVAYANRRQWEIATAGHIATVGGVEVCFATDPTSLTLMGGKVQRLQQPNPPETVSWQIGPVDFIDVPTADFIAIATAASDMVQASFDRLRYDVVPGLLNGTITTTEQIDAALAAS